MPPVDPPQPTEACPGCGAVLVRLTEDTTPSHPGASTSCTRLFEVTLRGLREEAGPDAGAATVVRLADAAYDAQHPDPADPDRLRTALEALEVAPATGRTPGAWRTTIADVAADLDVIDLRVLVEAWARSVSEDWTAVGALRH
ncbi:DUF5946 family protein [Blastococcus sp. CT_GayMR16]|uniref:DUF5946 family protein n=1 Tax=Blastococcus sp. CT_GayMR16 TaxID=2559607 RepID=UPI0010733E0D|nr:DUF5946 family protein [Blastococcus sp. CT_GayMR16]TFV90333.1 hypothetical protein E4P38_02515 [Blastococcus sp. CT_GayMR16]